jgi:hypothetical protein
MNELKRLCYDAKRNPARRGGLSDVSMLPKRLSNKDNTGYEADDPSFAPDRDSAENSLDRRLKLENSAMRIALMNNKLSGRNRVGSKANDSSLAAGSIIRATRTSGNQSQGGGGAIGN